MEKAVFAGGCFWCTEAIFKRLNGVESVIPGYTGGEIISPTYEEVCKGNTGHAEAIEITFNSEIISYEVLLDVFFYTHDPTTINRQGSDIGTQYRSVIFYMDTDQKDQAERYIKQLSSQDKNKKIVTEIIPFKKFYPAEDYHKNYYDTHPNAMYCTIVINPKLNKLMKKFSQILKP